MPRVYCRRYSSYTIWDRTVRYQFKGGRCEVDEAGLAFFKRQPMWGRLFTTESQLPAPPNPTLWKIPDPHVVPAVPPRAPDPPAEGSALWPPGYFQPDPFVCPRCGNDFSTLWQLQDHVNLAHLAHHRTVSLSRAELLGHSAPVPDLLRERFALAAQRRTSPASPANGQRHPAPPQPAPSAPLPIPRQRSSPKSDRATAWLRSTLRDRPLPSPWVIGQAKLARISKRTLDRACAAIGIVATKAGMTGGWVWSLPKTPNGDLREPPANVKSSFLDV
jgi:hypothetical protein